MQFECTKCCGSGRITAYSHIVNGVCFACKGSGKVAYSKRPAMRTVAPMAEVVPQAECLRIISQGDMTTLKAMGFKELRTVREIATSRGDDEVYREWCEMGGERYYQQQSA